MNVATIFFIIKPDIKKKILKKKTNWATVRVGILIILVLDHHEVPDGKLFRPAPGAYLSFHGNALRKVARLVDVASAEYRDVVGEELERDHSKKRGEYLFHFGHVYNMV